MKITSEPSTELSWRRNMSQDNDNTPSRMTNDSYRSGNQHQKSKRYTKTSHSGKSGQFGASNNSYNKQSLSNNSVSSNETNKQPGVINHVNSSQCLRETHVPLFQPSKSILNGKLLTING